MLEYMIAGYLRLNLLSYSLSLFLHYLPQEMHLPLKKNHSPGIIRNLFIVNLYIMMIRAA